MASSIIPFEKLGRRAELIAPMYLGCVVGLGVMAALLVSIEPDVVHTSSSGAASARIITCGARKGAVARSCM